MNLPSKKVRALGLCSGGLDSILLALVLQNQGIEVQWITFETPFFSSENARQASGTTGIPLMVRDITRPYLEMLKNPNCGYGKHMNPCMDCHALMFNQAGTIMGENGFDFLHLPSSRESLVTRGFNFLYSWAFLVFARKDGWHTFSLLWKASKGKGLKTGFNELLKSLYQ